MEIKLLSICIPTFNRYNYLDRLLTSLEHAKNNKQIEIIVSDNASEDGTGDIVNSHIIGCNNLFYYRNKVNLGPGKNASILVDRYSSGKFVWFIGDGCVVDASVIDELIDILEHGNDDVVIINGRHVDGSYFKKNKYDFVVDSAQHALDELGGHAQWLPSVISKKSILCNVLKKAEFDGHIDPHFAAFLYCIENYKSSFYHNLYVYVPGGHQDLSLENKEGYTDESMETKNSKRCWVETFFFCNDKALNYLKEEYNIIINPNNNFGTYQSVQFVRTYAVEKLNGGLSIANNYSVARSIVKNKNVFIIYIFIKFCPRIVLKLLWNPMSKLFKYVYLTK